MHQPTTYRLLVLTDHRTHSVENSIYDLLRALAADPRCRQLDVASRGIEQNAGFFTGEQEDAPLFAASVSGDFAFDDQGRFFHRELHRVDATAYDAIFLRLPHPVAPPFWDFIERHFPARKIINRPSGIRETSSKAFLLNFPEVCPPMQLCTSVEDILSFSRRYATVLKPLRGYGGQGIIRIEDDQVWIGTDEKTSLQEFLSILEKEEVHYLAMQFLPNVSQGDKRVIVVGGQVLGGTLRVPPDGSWICNAAQGGQAVQAQVDADEQRIAETITPVLLEKGIYFFGFDTLVGNDGRRVLSEINTMSIGGLRQTELLTGQPVTRRAASLIWDRVNSMNHGTTVHTN